MKTYIVMSLLSFLVACSQTPRLKQGAFYSVDDGEGFFRVAKILVLDPHGVHIRLYKNQWKERPAAVAIASLSLGSVHDADGFGIGHMALSKKEFAAWRPAFLQEGTVANDELDGYKMWKEGGGGHFGE